MPNELIYVAGNPDLYPLEYYDAETGTYRGAIPEMLAAFASDEGYDIVYYEPGSADRRASLASDVQVDVVSGVSPGESFSGTSDMLALFTADGSSGEADYGLVFTRSAPEGLAARLEAYAESRSASEITGELIAAASVERDTGRGTTGVPALAALGVAAAAVIAALAVALRRARAHARELDRELGIDACTGLYNQLGFERAFDAAVNESNRVLWYMLCFHFELGHIERVGGPGEIPRFQRFVADALRRRAEGGEIIARGNNGDFFALCQSDSAAGVRDWGMAALGDIKAYSCAGAGLGRSDAAVGVYPLCARTYDFESTLYYARQCAMTAARECADSKVCGADNCRICEEERELLSDLERGMKFGELRLYLQFLVRADTFAVTGAEALSRWQHPGRGLLTPDRYIPLLEREGRISELDFYNLDRACAVLEKLYAERGGGFYISCNFSRITFAQPELASQFEKIVARYSFPRHELMVEITESGLIRPDEAELMMSNIQAVRELGVHIMFDDFGMGYATFHDLLEYPMDGLKLDKSLVDNMGTERGRVIVDGIVRTGHSLGLTILAEGVETERQVEELRSLNCDLLQGYLFAVPLPENEALKRLGVQ